MAEKSSNETYGYTCQICEDGNQKQAAGFCKSCKLFMCNACIKYHGRMPLTSQHCIICDENFGQINPESFFQQRVVPTLRCSYSADYLKESRQILLSVYDEKKEDMFFVIHQNAVFQVTSNCYEIGSVTKLSGYKAMAKLTAKRNIELGSVCETSSCKSSFENCTYMTIPKTQCVIGYCHSHKSIFAPIKLPTGNDCYGITPFTNGLAVAVRIDMGLSIPDWHIKHLTYEGNIINEFYFDSDGKPLFHTPEYLASNSTQNILFVSDREETGGRVLAMDAVGAVLSKFCLPEYTVPYGITCDMNDNIIVAVSAGDKYKVLQIHSDGKRSRELFTTRGKLPIKHVCFNKKLQQLVVIDKESHIIFFKFVP